MNSRLNLNNPLAINPTPITATSRLNSAGGRKCSSQSFVRPGRKAGVHLPAFHAAQGRAHDKKNCSTGSSSKARSTHGKMSQVFLTGSSPASRSATPLPRSNRG